MIREPVAIGSWLVLAVISLVPQEARSRASNSDVLLTASAFFVAAAATRFWLQETRTREQILAFVAVAVVLAMARRSIAGRALSLPGFLACAGGTVAGSLLVKFWLEGLPF